MLAFLETIIEALGKKGLPRTKKIDQRSMCIFYKIVEAETCRKSYVLQRINTNIIFRASITDLVLDNKTLSSFHPVQACYLGMEYSR